jgi:hypothetical protein
MLCFHVTVCIELSAGRVSDVLMKVPLCSWAFAARGSCGFITIGRTMQPSLRCLAGHQYKTSPCVFSLDKMTKHE